MKIRRAEKKDLPMVHRFLQEVLEVHAAIRPDIFISGTTKYTDDQLLEIFADDSTPVFVAVDDEDRVLGHVFCVLKKPAFSTNMIDRKILYIDDLCVDEQARGQHVGSALYHYVREYAKSIGCYEVTLNVWEGNDHARAFYDHMGMKVKETMLEDIL